MSLMHRASKVAIDDSCNKYVSVNAIDEAEYWQEKYLKAKDDPDIPTEEKLEIYRTLLYNIPSGFELMAGMTTNYRCLKNIYHQRRDHRLPDWHVFCDWIETLPLSELITGKSE